MKCGGAFAGEWRFSTRSATAWNEGRSKPLRNDFLQDGSNGNTVESTGFGTAPIEKDSFK